MNFEVKLGFKTHLHGLNDGYGNIFEQFVVFDEGLQGGIHSYSQAIYTDLWHIYYICISYLLQ